MKAIEELMKELRGFVALQKFDIQPTRLYKPINYILDIGGKRIRPLLVLLAAQLYDDQLDEIYPLAHAIELFHNFTLMHDDIMDDAPLRRGRETVHVKYDISTGILSGDAMLLYSFRYLQTVREPELSQLIHESFTKTAIEICEGQQLDMDFESRSDVTIEQYLKMIELKTAVLLGLSLKIGAISKHASSKDMDHLYEFGRNMGIAFQIQDDVLDVYGDNEQFGKKSGGDIIQNKKTYLYLKALELSTEEQKEILNHLYTHEMEFDPNEKVSRVKIIFDELVVKEYARQLKEAYTDLAYSHLDAVSVDTSRKKNLKDIAIQLLNRAY